MKVFKLFLYFTTTRNFILVYLIKTYNINIHKNITDHITELLIVFW